MKSRNISFDSIYSNLGKHFCKVLPDYHGFPGSDFTVSFSRKGKIQSLKIYRYHLVEKERFSPFGHLGQLGDDQSNCFTEVEKFTCKMYGKKNLKKLDDVRTEVFMETCKPRTDRGNVSCA